MTSLWPEDFKVHPRHCEDVLGGAYDIPFEHPNPVILDIGSNIGAFTKWASGRWQNSTFHCFEPNPDNFSMLQRTVKDIPRVSCYRMGVLERNSYMWLIEGAFNCGEWSLFEKKDTPRNKISVPVMDAADLPTGDILKIDTEGAEPYILKRLIEVGRIVEFSAIMLEYHREGEQDSIPKLLSPHGFNLCEHHVGISSSRGELKFLLQPS